MIAHTLGEAYGWKPSDIAKLTEEQILLYLDCIQYSRTMAHKKEMAMGGMDYKSIREKRLYPPQRIESKEDREFRKKWHSQSSSILTRKVI